MRSLPPEPNPGDSISATLIRDLIRCIRERTPLQGHGMILSTGPNGTVFSSSATSRKSVQSYGVQPFACRYVKQDSSEGIPYTGWEIYLPTGCVTVNVTAKPMNPRAYRNETTTDGNGNESTQTNYLEGWYRMPEDSFSAPESMYVIVRTKCNSAVYGVDEISRWPVCHLWAEVCKATKRSPGDTLVNIVGTVEYTTSNRKTVRSYTQTASSPIATTANTNGNFELVHQFEVDLEEVELTLMKIYVRNPSFAAAGRTVVMEDLSEIDKDKEELYLKVDTQTGTASLMTFSQEEGGDSISDQVLAEETDFIIMIRLYTFEDGSVLYDSRQNLNNIQIYK